MSQKGHGKPPAGAKPPYKRQQYWVDAPLQLQMVSYVLFITAVSLLLTAFSVYRGVQESSAASLQLVHNIDWIKQAMRAPLLLASVICLIASGLLTLFWSHRFAGPLRVLSAGIGRVRHGNFAMPVRVRDTDAHQDLVREFSLMQDELRKKIGEDRAKVAEAIEILEAAESEASGETKAAVSKALDSLRGACASYHL
jgi:nitrogen fixation/metabolism regulation signal transduction histidine kinase